MTNLQIQEKNMVAVEAALVTNDLSKMSTEQRLLYYKEVCDSVGLNHLTQPLAFISLQGKITLYAKRDAADQLRKIHGVSIQILERKVENDLYIVRVKGMDRTGRVDEAEGIIPIGGLKGAELANAMLKTETKAKRRLSLSLCGLGLIDESELDTISNVSPTFNPQIVNPFKDVSPEALPPAIDQTETIDAPAEVKTEEPKTVESENPFDAYTINAGPKSKLTGTKLKDHTPNFLLQTVESSAKWHEENKREMHKNTKEFVDMVYDYLKHIKFIPF